MPHGVSAFECCSKTWNDVHHSGEACFDISNRVVLIDNTDAFAIHDIDTGSCLNVYSTARPTRRVPKKAVFSDNGAIVVAGSDHGDVYVFERRGGHPLAVLEHAKDGYTQTVAAFSNEMESLVACATSSGGVSSSVSLWRSEVKKTPVVKPRPPRSSETLAQEPATNMEHVHQAIKNVLAMALTLWILKAMLVRGDIAYQLIHSIDVSQVQAGLWENWAYHWQVRVRPMLIDALYAM